MSSNLRGRLKNQSRYKDQDVCMDVGHKVCEVTPTPLRPVSLQNPLRPPTMNETKPPIQSAPTHDEVFYWENIVFLVENTLFNVPRYHFENFSEVFKTMFTLPHGDNIKVDGSSDECPLVLQGVTAQEFRSLLNVMLHPEPPLLTKEEWLDALKLSNMWRLINIRNIAIRQLSDREDMSFTDKIVWGRCYKVANWMIAGYSGLIDRGDVLSLDEGVRIGVPGSLGIWRSQSISGGGNRYRRSDTEAIVLEVFEEEIRDVRTEELEYGPVENDSCPPTPRR